LSTLLYTAVYILLTECTTHVRMKSKEVDELQLLYLHLVQLQLQVYVVFHKIN
jgi:hypothetical protein